MKNIFPAVFSSVWKRKETKIYLIFAFFALVYLVSSFFGNSNFMKITVLDGGGLSNLSFIDMMINSIDGFVLPTLAIYFLTISVFKKEVDEHTMFLYRDLSRTKVFIAKYISLILVSVIFYLLFFAVSTGVYYSRVIHMPIGSGEFLESTLSENLPLVLDILSFFMKDILSITVAAVVSLYFGTGATMVTAVVMTITMMITPIIGGLVAMLFPNGYLSLVETSAAIAFAGTVGITLLYAIPLIGIGIKKFKSLEF